MTFYTTWKSFPRVWPTLDTQLYTFSSGCRQYQMYIYKSIAVLLKFKTSNKLFHRKLMQEKHLQTPYHSTETHWNSSNQNIFPCTPVILWECKYFIMLIIKFPVFVLFLEHNVVPRYIVLIILLSKLYFYYIQGLFEFVELLWQQYQFFLLLTY